MPLPKSPKKITGSAKVKKYHPIQPFLRFPMFSNRCILAKLFNRLAQVENLKLLIGLLLWGLIFALLMAWRAQNLDAFGPSNDEGAYLMWSQLPLDGYPLYTATRAVQPPLFFEWIGLALRLGGSTIAAGRWSTLVMFALLAASLSWLAYQAKGWSAALAALLLLGLAPLAFTFSRLVLAEIPATALAVLSMALLIRFIRNQRQMWLFASGLAFGLSLLIKVLNPFLAAPVGLLLLFKVTGWPFKPVEPASRQGRALIGQGLLWGIGTSLPLLVILLLYDPAAMYDQLIAFRGDLRAAEPGSWAETWAQFDLFFKSHWGFWLLAAGGLVSAWRGAALPGGFAQERFFQEASRRGAGAGERRSRGAEEQPFQEASRGSDSSRRLHAGVQECRSGREEANLDSPNHLATLPPFIWLVWLVAAVAFLTWHSPLFPHHLVALLPPLILLGAGFVADTMGLWQGMVAGEWRPWLSQDRLAHSGVAVGFSVVIIIAAFNLPVIVEANQKAVAVVTGGREAEALKLLQAVSAPGDFLMGDSQLLIFMAGRRTPPPLGDVALVAIKAGWQTPERLITLTGQYQAPAVVQWSLRLPWLPDYLTWVEANYLARRVWDNDHLIYFAPRLTEAAVPNPIELGFGDKVKLRGYEIGSPLDRAGQTLILKVYWQAEQPLTEDYTVFTQLLDANGQWVTGWDSQPLGGYFPTSQWPAGEIIADVVQLSLPAGLPAGDYTLITGLYRLETLERLTTATGRNYAVLTTITLSAH